MNLSRVAQILGITESRLQGLQETIIRESAWPEPRLLRFEKEASGIEAGTVVFENGEIKHLLFQNIYDTLSVSLHRWCVTLLAPKLV